MTRLALFFSFATSMLLIASAYAADPEAQQDANLAPATRDSLSDFFVTSCPLTWYGVTLYGTIDMGVTWQNHGTPFNERSRSGIEYLLSKNGNGSGFNRAPNATTQSNIGLKGNEELVFGWAFIFDLEAEFSPRPLTAR
jgi:hypothetical protein